MEMIIDFPGGARVDAHFGKFTVQTDQPTQGGGEDSAPGDRIQLVTSPAHPLDKACNLPGGAKLDDMIDPADINAQFHRRSTDKGPDLPPLEAFFRIDPDFLRQRPVVHLNIPVCEEGVPQGFCRHPGVDKDKGGSFSFQEFSENFGLVPEVVTDILDR